MSAPPSDSAPPAGRIFLASSAELKVERARFPGLIEEIGARSDIARQFSLRSVVWEHDAFGVGASIHDTITSSTEFDTLDVVVLVVWNRVGEGTLREYRDARALWNAHRRPALLVFFRQPSPDADAADLERVVAFKRRLLDEGVATNEYRSPAELEQRLREQIPQSLAVVSSSEPTPFVALRRRFLLAAAATTAAAALAIFLCRTLSFPGGVTERRIYLIIVLPIVLALGSSLVAWYYHRLLESLKRIWHSPQWTDAQAYEAFRSVVPRPSLPPRLRRQFPAGWASTTLTVGVLVVILFVPVVGQYQCLFEELLVWEYTVSREFDVDPAGRVVSRYVDRHRKPWPFGLQDETVKRRHRERNGGTIYVHAQGKFAAGQALEPDQRFRRNLGPQVFLPWQPWVYVMLMAVTLGEGLFTLARLVRLPAEFRSEKPSANSA